MISYSHVMLLFYFDFIHLCIYFFNNLVFIPFNIFLYKSLWFWKMSNIYCHYWDTLYTILSFGIKRIIRKKQGEGGSGMIWAGFGWLKTRPAATFWPFGWTWLERLGWSWANLPELYACTDLIWPSQHPHQRLTNVELDSAFWFNHVLFFWRLLCWCPDCIFSCSSHLLVQLALHYVTYRILYNNNKVITLLNLLSITVQSLVTRLKENLEKLTEERDQRSSSENREKEQNKRLQRQIRDIKEEMGELAKKETEASRKKHELVRMRQTVQSESLQHPSNKATLNWSSFGPHQLTLVSLTGNGHWELGGC